MRLSSPHAFQVSTPDGVCVNLGIMQTHAVRARDPMLSILSILSILLASTSKAYPHHFHPFSLPPTHHLSIPGDGQRGSCGQPTNRSLYIRTSPAKAALR